MMKKAFALTLSLALILAVSLAAAETFRMGIDAEYPPFSYLDDSGNYAGFDVEMCKAVCDMNGWDLEIVPVNWDFKLISLDNNEHDCVWSGMTILDSMKEAGYVLSFPYYDNTQVVLTREDTGIKTSADLAGKRVAVQRGTSGDQLLQGDQAALAATFEGGAAVTMDDFTVCVTELAANGVDAVVIDLPVAKAHQAKNAGFVILDENLGSEQYGICFRKGDEALCEKVEAGIMKLVEDGTYLSLAEKYGLDANVLCLLNAE
ncbi:MAG: transporter substrate-binding domain-containing protein [Clostridiales bacterium]|nr:transporter substrate-binding domain-containing protein [Clostridiales bacterium]